MDLTVGEEDNVPIGPIVPKKYTERWIKILRESYTKNVGGTRLCKYNGS